MPSKPRGSPISCPHCGGTGKLPVNDLATFLKALRVAKNMTLREVEERTNGAVSNPYLSQLENGKVGNPSPAILDELAEVYDVDYFELLELAHPRKARRKKG